VPVSKPANASEAGNREKAAYQTHWQAFQGKIAKQAGSITRLFTEVVGFIMASDIFVQNMPNRGAPLPS
jgi:hypothetical protein